MDKTVWLWQRRRSLSIDIETFGERASAFKRTIKRDRVRAQAPAHRHVSAHLFSPRFLALTQPTNHFGHSVSPRANYVSTNYPSGGAPSDLESVPPNEPRKTLLPDSADFSLFISPVHRAIFTRQFLSRSVYRPNGIYQIAGRDPTDVKYRLSISSI